MGDPDGTAVVGAGVGDGVVGDGVVGAPVGAAVVGAGVGNGVVGTGVGDGVQPRSAQHVHETTQSTIGLREPMLQRAEGILPLKPGLDSSSSSLRFVKRPSCVGSGPLRPTPVRRIKVSDTRFPISAGSIPDMRV